MSDSVQHVPSDIDSSKGEEQGEEQGEEREEEKNKEIVPGSLRVTKYSWFEAMGGASSVASISTAGCKTVSIALPPGYVVCTLYTIKHPNVSIICLSFTSANYVTVQPWLPDREHLNYPNCRSSLNCLLTCM